MRFFLSLQDSGAVRKGFHWAIALVPATFPLPWGADCDGFLLCLDPLQMSIQRSFQRARPVSTLLLEIQVFLAEVTPFFFLLLINTQATLAPWPPIPAYLTGSLDAQSLWVHAALGAYEAIHTLLFYSHTQINVFLNQKLWSLTVAKPQTCIQ